MDVTLEIHFTGLCAFVPKKPIDQGNNHATVLLVNARQSHHGGHHALLLAEEKFYPKVSNRPAANTFQIKIADGSPITVKACVFADEEITIVGLKDDGSREMPPADTLTFAHGYKGKSDVCPKAGNLKTDFAWVLTNPGKVNPELLTSFDRGDVVGMRMLLTSGKLKTDLFRMIIGNRIIKWHFGEKLEAIAEEVIYELTFKDDTEVKTIALESIPFGAAEKKIPLILTPSDDGAPIKVWIVNMIPGDLLRLADPLPFEPDHHYEEFYNLCLDKPEPLLHPIPDSVNFCAGFGAISNPKCPPTQFAPPETQLSSSEGSFIHHEHE